MRLLIVLIATMLFLVGCNQAEIDAWNVQNAALRQQISDIRADVAADPTATPSEIAKIENTLARMEALVAKSEEAAAAAETEPAEAFRSLLPFPYNLLAGVALTLLGVTANRKRLEIKRKLAAA